LTTKTRGQGGKGRRAEGCVSHGNTNETLAELMLCSCNAGGRQLHDETAAGIKKYVPGGSSICEARRLDFPSRTVSVGLWEVSAKKGTEEIFSVGETCISFFFGMQGE